MNLTQCGELLFTDDPPCARKLFFSSSATGQSIWHFLDVSYLKVCSCRLFVPTKLVCEDCIYLCCPFKSTWYPFQFSLYCGCAIKNKMHLHVFPPSFFPFSIFSPITVPPVLHVSPQAVRPESGQQMRNKWVLSGTHEGGRYAYQGLSGGLYPSVPQL